MGRSGSGKTTALRLINRLVEPAGGELLLNGRAIQSTDAITLRRGIGYVIQEFGLLPHWTVGRNIGLVPTLLQWPAARIEERTTELLTQVGLSDFGARYPNDLSGGQRQRVAVARAFAAEPEMLLFDEPFGALDPVTRHDMQQLFLNMRTRYQGASVFVTHDVAEALVLGTRIAVLDQGRLETVLTPAEFRHAQTPVARAFRETLHSEATAP